MAQPREQQPAVTFSPAESGSSAPASAAVKGRSKRLGRQRGRGELARSAALVILAVLITLFAVLNLKQVKVDWIFGSGHAPLIVVIVISLLVGIVLTYIAERVLRKRR
jgi:uncharacterized integral membrane protein